MTRAALTCLLVLGGSVAPAPAPAQHDTTARILGTVRSSVNGLPTAGVMVAVRGARVFGVSDSAGSLDWPACPPGRRPSGSSTATASPTIRT